MLKRNTEIHDWPEFCRINVAKMFLLHYTFPLSSRSMTWDLPQQASELPFYKR